ncbi:DUF1294 domain-containing protein [Flavobacterium sp. JAS]|uniref:DUF1294 domain-containing protein n=1 Tax=Flavobacterium sp. JAS TaxID=2897329 RepID=UPI001E391EDC|nr:DUF1294 domain-containing protein [Flavobacterium sp. JAS]MCD0469414.1 DUF1294 domain-containing protein [Flavobacterium sp. JAS]
MEILLLYFFIVNIIAFVLAGYDKYLAVKHKQRIPENTLFATAFFGGSVGLLLAMLSFRHKTSKSSFIIKFGIILLLQIVLIYLKLTRKI